MPTAPRIVTGNIAILTGEAREGIDITFTRTGAGDVFGQYGDVVVNEPVKATSGTGGAFTVTLYPGTYKLRAAGSNGPKEASLALSEDGSTDLADLIGQASAPITSTEVADARSARDKAQEWATNPEDDPVEPGEFSARHWAAKAEGYANSYDAQALAEAVAATEADALATDADRVQTGLDRVATGADRVQTGLDRVQTGLDRDAAETANAQAQEAAGIHSAVAEQVGTIGTALGQTLEEVTRLTDAQDDNTVNIAALMALAQMLGQIADQINGGRVALDAGTLADPALRIGTAGIYSAAPDTLSVAIAGVERLRITTDGITVYGNITDA